MARNNLSLRIDSNVEAMARQLRVSDPRDIRRGTVSAINRTMTKARKTAINASAKSIGIAAKWIRQRTKVRRASQAFLQSVTTFNPRGVNPHNIGWSAGKTDAYYKGPRAPGARVFSARMPNGSQQFVIRLPKSVSSEGRDSKGRLRKGRLPLQSVRVFIGKKTIAEFTEYLDRHGPDDFDDFFAQYIDKRIRAKTRANERKMVRLVGRSARRLGGAVF